MKNFKRVICTLLTLIMVLGVAPMFAIASSAADYATSKDGDTLYTVDFRMTDGIYVEHYIDKTLVPTFSEDGHVLNFGEKATGSMCYSGSIPSLPLLGNVYTVSYWIENTDPANVRQAVQILRHNSTRYGLSNVKAAGGNFTHLTTTQDGTNGVYFKTSQARKVDKELANRQYFKVVMDGVDMNAKFYVQIEDGTYELLTTVSYDYLTTEFSNTKDMSHNNRLYVSMFVWDAIKAGNRVSLGDVVIKKGDLMPKTAAEQKYAAAKYGDVLYSVNFKGDENFKWQESGTGIAPSGVEAVDAATANINSTENTPQRMASLTPIDQDLHNLSFTLEFFAKSDKRIGLNLFKQSYNLKYAGFAINNDKAKFMCGGGFATEGSQAYKDLSNTGKGDRYGFQLKAYKYGNKLDMTNPDAPNVKIEFDHILGVATMYELSAETGKFEKTAAINYTLASGWKSMVYVYAWDADTNATFKNMNFVKGLTVSGVEESKVVEVDFAGVPQYTAVVDDTLALPAVPERNYYVAKGFTDDGGKAVTSMNQFKYENGLNKVNLIPVYEKAGLGGKTVAIRGVQETAVADGKQDVRFVAVIDSKNFDKVGFMVEAAYKDAQGNVLYSNKTLNLSTGNVYNSVAEGVGSSVTAEDLGGSYLYALNLRGVVAGEGVQVDFYVTPYTEVGGKISTGDVMTISYVNGVYTPDAVPVE